MQPKMKVSIKTKKWGAILLFTSIPTLICCAIPILLVSLGMGSVVATLYNDQLPILQWFGVNSALTFLISGAILFFSAWLIYKPNRSCPTDPELAKACRNAHKWNIRFFWLAATIWLVSAFTAFILPIIAL